MAAATHDRHDDAAQGDVSAPVTLADLACSAPVVAARTPVAELERLFRFDRSLRAVIVHTDDDYRLLSREHLFSELAGPFGYGRALHARSVAASLVPAHTLVLSSALPPGDAAYQLLGIPEQHRHLDIVVTSASRDPQIVTVASVFEHLATTFRAIAMLDPLTGLPNRRSLEQFAAELARHGVAPERIAVLYIDLDGFKIVNDTFGHRAGDIVLVQFAERLRAAVRPTDVVARLGGDEFAVVLFDVSSEVAEAIAQRIVLAASSPFLFDDEPLAISASVGVTMADDVRGEEGLTQLDVLLRQADLAMLQAKQFGKRRVNRLVDGTSTAQLARDGLVRRRLRHALNHGQLTLHYQPKLDLRTGRCTDVEALLRWTDDELGPVSPAEFIPIAETSRQINRIGAFVLDNACAQAKRWSTLHQFGSVAVNVSAHQFDDEGFVGEVAEVLRRHDLDPRHLRLEITEGAAMRDVDRTARQVKALNELGVAVELDDFGTGYSSLSVLRTLPLATLKIDKSFVDTVDTDAAMYTLVNALVAAAHAWQITVVAEGVERAEQLGALRRMDCDVAQGFLVARPQPADQACAVIVRADVDQPAEQVA